MVFEGEVAIVTGSGQGIGKAIALRFAREGADIGVMDVNGETAAATGQEIRRLGRRAAVIAAHVSDPAAVQRAIGAVASELGRLDVLVNNAGIERRALCAPPRQPFPPAWVEGSVLRGPDQGAGAMKPARLNRAKPPSFAAG